MQRSLSNWTVISWPRTVSMLISTPAMLRATVRAGSRGVKPGEMGGVDARVAPLGTRLYAVPQSLREE
jgi:hypothetical protein